MKKEIKAESITLRTDNGDWLGQIVITDDGMFSAVTDWGNFSFAWRSFGSDFKKFLIGLDEGYFATKMCQGFGYICYNKKIEDGAFRFAKKILPALQNHLKSNQEG